MNVGSYSLLGSVVDAYGAAQLAPILDGLTKGTFLLLLDALDEAELRAGSHNFDAFLTHLCQMCQATRPKPTSVVSARKETADLLTLYFDEQAVSYGRYRIDFFDETAARTFVEKRLDADPKAVHRAYQAAFNEARDLLFKLVYRVLGAGSAADPWSLENVRSFLGYAPVLEVLAEYLHVTNYALLVSELRQQVESYKDQMAASEGLLQQVVHKILRREQTKVRENLEKSDLSKLAAAKGWSAWDTLYSPDEQCERVLRHAHRAAGWPGPSVQLAMPDALREAYEKQIGAWLPQHPFVGETRGFAGNVFEEYVYAWVFAGGRKTLMGPLERSLLSVGYRPSPLLGSLYTAASSEGAPPVPSEHFGLLYESLLSQAKEPGAVRLSLRPDEGSESLAVLSLGSGPSERESVEIKLDSTGEGITFWRRLQHADVDFSGRVCLGLAGGAFSLGPAVVIECGLIEIPAGEVIVASDDSGAGVTLIAGSHVQSGQTPKLRVVSGAPLVVQWPNTGYPWAQHAVQAEAIPPTHPDLPAAFKQLCRTLGWFHGGGYGGLTRTKKLIDNPRVTGSTPLALGLREFLKAEGIIRDAGGLYRLDVDRMAELGINWTGLSRRVMDKRVRDFLLKYLSS